MRLLNNLTFRVLVAISLGVALGVYSPDTAKAMRPLGDTFISLVKMVIGPIVFLTIALGIANMDDLKKVGKVGLKAFVYFEVVTAFALVIGLVVVNVTKPGGGLDVSSMARGDISAYTAPAREMRFVDFLLNMVPSSPVKAFADGDILQIVFFAVLFGVALTGLGQRGKPVVDLFDSVLRVFFKITSMIMVVAPVGAFGAMAFTIGNFGVKALLPLARLMLDVYVTMALFVFIVLNLICRYYGFSLWRFLKFIKDELLLVLGTSSSEAALPSLMTKLERYGCARPIVGLVVPAGYSFNLDGTSIYLSMASIFIAQAFQVDLSLTQQLSLLAVLTVTNNGAAGVTGSGFIVLASTLAATKVVPVEGLAIVLGVDRFMSEARAIVNLIGNGVATLVISRTENAFDDEKMKLAHQGQPVETLP